MPFLPYAPHKRGYAGSPNAGTLGTLNLTTGTLTGSFTSSTTLSGWTDVLGNSFVGTQIVVSFGYGTSAEEKILCTFDNSNTFTIVSRGYENTPIGTWTVGTSTFILVASATELAEANAAVQSLSTLLQNAGTLTAPQPIAYSATTSGSVGSGTTPAAIDHSHNLSASTLNSWLVGGAAGTVASGVFIPYSQITNAPALAASDAQSNVNPVSITTSYPTTAGSGILSTPVNPNGAFAKYSWEALATVNGTASATTAASAILLYRVAGSNSAWSQAQAVAGVTTNYGRLVASGVLSAPVAGTDYEFQLGFIVGTGSQSIYYFTLKVIGTN